MKGRLIILLILGAPTLALAAAPRTFSDLANLIVSLFDAGAGLLITAAIVIYLFGISRSIFKAGEEGKEMLRTYLVWGIITIFLMVSIWGILRLLQNTLFGSSSYSNTGSEIGIHYFA